MKTCVVCNETKELELFQKRKENRDGRGNRCKLCHTKYMREYYKKNPAKEQANRDKCNKYVPNWKRHKLTEGQYRDMLALHDGKCHSCKAAKVEVVDHDHSCCVGSHSCGKCVRGLLCKACNSALGHMQDDIDKLNGLVQYLTINNMPLSSIG